ncbi:hypothetical protein HUN92_13600 [Bacillus firmus]|uniref:SAF domain-containing protein n=1 Tax=Cytobacillus firmus TaxID=1399 RepID=UPI001580FE16|nr:SAF domain-containing protein [Cytobacillus firmus]NUH84755.1 hypothetical protein [Cytobacillus firmus]
MKKKSIWKKRIISLLTVVALIGSIFIYTQFTIKAEINEREVIVTKTEIPPRTEITEDMLETIVVPTQGIPSDAVNSKEDIVGKWTVAGYGIPSHSFIYGKKIVSKSEMPDAGILELEENEVAFPLLVDLETSLGNSIIPDSKVDLYFRSLVEQDEKSKAIYGKLASKVRVVAVKDADAQMVFDPEGYQQGKKQDNTNKEQTSLAKIYIFAIPEELNGLINKAKLLGQIVPIATGKSDEVEEEATNEESEVIKYVEESSVSLEKEEGEE